MFKFYNYQHFLRFKKKIICTFLTNYVRSFNLQKYYLVVEFNLSSKS